MAALIRSTRVPLWALSLRYRSPYVFKTLHTHCQREQLLSQVSALCFTRCVSTGGTRQAVAATNAVEDGTTGGQHVDRMINNLDRNVRRFGRLSLYEIERVIQKMEEDGSVTDNQSLLLIRCMGSTLAEIKQEDRTQLLEQMCDRLKKLGAVFSIQHHNALLMVHLQNEHRFSPTDFLTTLEKENIPANRVTYQRLIGRYCLDGDIQGASQILDHMKTKQLPINEQVFNALITGHFRANDVSSAMGILDIMSQAGVEPGQDTYAALLNGYAEQGDMKGIRDVKRQAQQQGLTLHPNVLFSTLLTLARNGKETEAYELLPEIEKLPGFGIEAMSCSLQLVSIGLDELAFTVFSCTGKPVVYDKEDSTMGRFLIRGMVRAERPPDKLAAMLEKMRAEQFNHDTITIAAQLAYNNNQTEYAVSVLDYMKEQGTVLRLHYFWPAICQYRDKGEKEKLMSVVHKIHQTCTSIGNDDLFQTLNSYIVPALLKLNCSEDEIRTELKGAGYGPEFVNFSYMLQLLLSRGIEEAFEFGRSNPVEVFYGAVRPLLVPLYKKRNDVNPPIQVLKFVEEFGKIPTLSVETNGWFLLDFLNNVSSLEDKEKVIVAMKNANLTVFKQDAEEVKNILSRFNQKLSPEAQEALEVIKSEEAGNRRQTTNMEPFSELTLKDLEAKLEANPDNRSIQKFLLIKYCQEGNVERANEIKEKLDATGFVYSSLMLRQLALFEGRHTHNLQQAQNYLKQLLDQHPDFEDYVRVRLNISALQIRNGQTEEAMSAFKDYCEKHENFLVTKKFGYGYSMEEDISRVVEALTETKQMTVAKEFIQLVFDKKLIRSGTANVLRTYISGYINSDDGEGAIDALGWAMSVYGKTPAVNDIIKMFIKKEDPDQLQKVVDLLTSHRGEMNVLHQLMVSFIECGDVKRAKKIVETPGLRAVMNILSYNCGVFVKERKLKELEDLVSITKNLFGVDRDEMIFNLIRYHALDKNWSKALNVLVDYEEEGIQPRSRTLRYLAKALENDGQPVPFETPQPYRDSAREDGSNMSDSSLSPVEQKAIRLIRSGGVSAVQDIHKDLKLSGDEIQAAMFLKNIVTYLVEKNYYRDFSILMRELARSGDVNALLDLKAVEFPETHQFVREQQLFHAYLNSNRAEEIISHLEQNPADADHYFTDGAFNLLSKKYPDLLNRVEALAKATAGSGSSKVANHLWTHYFCQDETNKADAIIKEHPDLVNTLRVFLACKHVLTTKQEDKFTHLLSLIRGKNPSGVALVYRHIILSHLNNNDTEAIERVLEEAKNESVPTSFLASRTRNSLISLFQSQGKSIPTQLAFFQDNSKTSNKSSTSSSSSSSSDDEKEPQTSDEIR